MNARAGVGAPAPSEKVFTTLPRLILLPGLDGTGRLFAPFEDAIGLALPRTVVSYTSPEVSEYEACRAVVMDRLPQNEPYVLVGESFSGPVAIAIAARNPKGLCGLVLVASFVSCPRPVLKRLTALTSIMPTHGASDWLTDYLLLGRFATPAIREMLKEAMGMVTPRAVRSRLREIAKVDVSSALLNVSVPVLYLRAVHDRLVPAACGDEIARLARRVKVADVSAPHMLLQCAPSDTAGLIVSFARSCVAQS